MKCVYETYHGFCVKRSDMDVREPCVEGPCDDFVPQIEPEMPKYDFEVRADGTNTLNDRTVQTMTNADHIGDATKMAPVSEGETDV